MSGFITIYNTDGEPVERSLLYSLTQTLKFRGPDQQKVWVDGNIGMGHALFKTTFEAEYENQPATIDNKVWVTCSARIDDRENLINKMELKQSLDLSKTPDSELILHAYRKWGEECLEHLLGDFAFVIWDKTQQKIFAARDRFGMKQLYYAKKNKSFIICNTLGCILKHPNINKDLNERAIGGFLLFGNYTWMDKSLTMFNDITTLLPAHKLVFKNNQITIQRYWNIPGNIPLLHYNNKQDYIDHFLEVLTNSISDRMRSNSIAISMSGGMDSTSVAAIVKQLQKHRKTSSIQINAVTLAYDHIIPSQERHYAGLVAKHLKIPIHYIIGDNYSFLHPTIRTTYPKEFPQPTLWKDIEKKLSEFSRVVLVGDAADELMEYPSTSLALKEVGILNTIKYVIELQKLYGKKLPLGIRTKIKTLLSSNTQKLITSYPYPSWINQNFEKKLNLKMEWEKTWNSLREKKSIHSRTATLGWSLSNPDWCADDLYMKSDFTLSEKRDPFLDLRMVEFILALPALPWLFNKHILRQSMKNLLPEEVRFRPKQLLGYINHAVAIKEENKWLGTWKPTMLTSPYIKETFYFSQSDIPSNHYLKSRAIILDKWLYENIH